jgi:hypothetical protein
MFNRSRPRGNGFKNAYGTGLFHSVSPASVRVINGRLPSPVVIRAMTGKKSSATGGPLRTINGKLFNMFFKGNAYREHFPVLPNYEKLLRANAVSYPNREASGEVFHNVSYTKLPPNLYCV